MSRVSNHVRRCSTDHKLCILPFEIDAGVGIRSQRDVLSAAFRSSWTPWPQMAEIIVACGLQRRPNLTFTSITILPSHVHQRAPPSTCDVPPANVKDKQFCTGDVNVLQFMGKSLSKFSQKSPFLVKSIEVNGSLI